MIKLPPITGGGGGVRKNCGGGGVRFFG